MHVTKELQPDGFVDSSKPFRRPAVLNEPEETNQADQPQANNMEDVGIVMIDENGNRARVYQDGRIEEL